MRIGFVVDEKGYVSVNALTNAGNLEEFAKSDAQDEGIKAIALLDLDDFKSENRGDLGDAFEALRLLIGVNHFHKDSLCYAVEEMLEQVFEAGRKYERESKRKGFEAIADALDQNLEHLKKTG